MRAHRLMLSLLATLVVAACGGKSPTAPDSSNDRTNSAATGGPQASQPGTLTVTGQGMVQPGESTQFRARLTVNGTDTDVTAQATWSSDNTNVATVNASGLVTGAAIGGTDIRAAYQGYNASAPIHVRDDGGGGNPSPTPPTVLHLRITGTPCGIVGQTAQLQAIASMSNGTEENVTAVATWSSGNTTIATVSAGFVRCNAEGRTEIRAEHGGQSASVPVEVKSNGQPPQPPNARDLIGIEVSAEANVLGGGGTLRLDLKQLLSDPTIDVRVFALYSDKTKEEVTAASVITTDTPLLVVRGPGLLNAAGVMVQALVDPDHVVNVTYGGFTVIVNVRINAPILGELPIKGVRLPNVLSLTAGTQLPALTALLDDGLGGTVELIVPAATAGVVFEIRARDYVPILGPIAGDLVNKVLVPLGNLVGKVITIVDGKVQKIELGPIAGILSLIDGVLLVDVRAIINGVVSNSVPCGVSLATP